MPSLSPSLSDLTVSSSDKPRGKSSQKKSIRSTSWSAWLSGSAFRGTDAHGEPMSNVNRKNDEATAKPGPSDEMVIGNKENQSDGFKKYAAVEEPAEETGNSTESDAHSDAGTVRRPRAPSGQTPPKFVLPPGAPSDHMQRTLSHNDICHSPQNDVLERHMPHNSDCQRPGARSRLSGPRRTSQTVSRDDFLTARGANPRTGVVSPDLTDHSHLDDLEPQVDNSGGAMNNQKWRLKGDQWISLDASERTPVPTPPSNAGMNSSLLISSRDQAEAHVAFLAESGVPLKNLEDRFVVNMPSVREPCPPSMTPQQIADFQQACNRFYRYDNNMIHPSRVPSPRPRTPDGPSTPPKRLSKVRETLLQSTGPLDRGRRKDRPPGSPHNQPPHGASREWRHSSAPPASRPQYGWKEHTNKYFLGGPGYGREERIPPPQKRRHRHPPGPDQYRPTGHSSHRGPQEIPYQGHRGPSMPTYPRELHSGFRRAGPIGRQNLDHLQDRSFSRDLYLEPQSYSRQTIQVGASDGNDLLATITTTTTTSTVTPVRLSASDVETYFTPTEISMSKSCSEQSHGVSRESITTTATMTGSVINAENAENTASVKQATAVHHAAGTQSGKTRHTNNENDMETPAIPLTKRAYYHLLPAAMFYLTLIAMTYREYRENLLVTRSPGLRPSQDVKFMKIALGAVFVAVAVSIIFRD
ncbi:hypothetical protein MGYG_02934 [Nannizzia gypsea CBS 118893]|uniref:Uncharacterized protein n=1 Tax=Arthroderma gypseum (strain ATCC MYA-4604 / CBS 118893) TaxID=535722 RepID=E4UPV5_ARTGP|nr:hypothetical protein MGYG_02934 [Nannizzia gypsea CBS 118893]EFQ99927.1 hypothetical protein MGYG_02934 [Nannizzia gypsea CBS 118893]